MSADSRSTHRHDKDHPAGFDPQGLDLADWRRRAENLALQVLVSQGLWPMPEKLPLSPVVHGAIDRDQYTIEKVFFASLPGHYVTGNLYRPTGRAGRLPAVLCPYGHWPGGRLIWKNDKDVQAELDSGGEKTVEAARTPLQATCAMLARMGCVVFHYDMVGHGDSTGIAHGQGFFDAEAVLRGQSFMGLQTWNSIRALDFLSALDDVDPQRIAVTGSSGGATQAISLFIVDDRPKLAFPMVMVSMNMQGGCSCENAPLYRVGTNNVELASLFAPKPMGLAAANDWTHDFLSRGLPEMKAIYRLFGAEDAVEGRHFAFGHNHNLHGREFLYTFLNERFKLGLASPVKEVPFDPVPPEDLRVFDDAHPLPADVLDAPQLRREMTLRAEEQMARLRDDPAAYRAVVGTAMRAMVVEWDGVPGEVENEFDAKLPADSQGVVSGWIGRIGSGERVACKAMFPAKWKGETILWAHPMGCASLTVEAAAPVLTMGVAVVSIDMFAAVSRESSPAASTYADLAINYNRGVLADRVHDLVTAVGWIKRWNRGGPIHLAAFAGAGAEGLLARALLADAIGRAAIDLDGFDFDRVEGMSDPMLLPAALKYGGIYGVVPLCAGRATLICGARETGMISLAKGTPGVVVEREGPDAEGLVGWVTEPHNTRRRSS